MRRIAMLRVAVPLLLVGLPVRGHAQAAPPDAMTAVRSGHAEVAGWIVRAAEMVPDSLYGYKPTPAVRSLGQLIGHIADGNNFYCGRATGANTPWVETVGNSGWGKAQLLQALRQSVDACTAAHTAANASRIAQLIANVGHANLHYGNLITYLRMLGLTPPSS